MPVLGQLTKLTFLRLDGPMSQYTASQGLLYLTNLHQLKQLVGFKAAGRQAITSFWEAVQGRRE